MRILIFSYSNESPKSKLGVDTFLAHRIQPSLLEPEFYYSVEWIDLEKNKTYPEISKYVFGSYCCCIRNKEGELMVASIKRTGRHYTIAIRVE